MRAAIVLAAGRSRRFGRAHKLLAIMRGKPLLAHALDRAREAGVDRIVLVVRRRDPRITRVARGDAAIAIVRAPDADAGLSASLRAGLAALRPIEREAWIFLADMPMARARPHHRLSGGTIAARPIVDGRPGHPMLVRVAAARAATVAGDRGLAAVLPRDAIAHWRGRPGDLLDIDDQCALRRFRRSGR